MREINDGLIKFNHSSKEWVLRLNDSGIEVIPYNKTSQLQRFQASLGFGPLSLANIATYIETHGKETIRAIEKKKLDSASVYKQVLRTLKKHNADYRTIRKVDAAQKYFFKSLPVEDKLKVYASKILDKSDIKNIQKIFKNKIAYIPRSAIPTLITLIHNISELASFEQQEELINKIRSTKESLERTATGLDQLPLEIYRFIELPAKEISQLKQQNRHLREAAAQPSHANKILSEAIKSFSKEELLEYLSQHGNFILELDLSNLHFNTVIKNQDLKRIVEKCPNLKSLNLKNCKNISNIGLKYIKKLTNLRELNLMDTGVNDGAGFDDLLNLHKLESLSLSGRIGDEGVYDLTSLANLKSLNLSSEFLTNEGIYYIDRFPNLQSLCLRRCGKLTFGIIEHLASFKQLRWQISF